MKSSLIALLCGCLLTVTTVQAQETDTTWTPGVFMAQSLNSCFDAGQVFLDLEDTEYGYDDGGISLVGTYMQPYEYYTLTKYFETKQSYIVIAAGDEDATDVDLRILNADYEIVSEDTEIDRIAIVEFTPREGADFTIEVELYDAQVASFVSFVILRSGGWTIPRSDFDIAMNSLIQRCANIDSGLGAAGRYLRFNSETGNACLFGGLISGESSTTLTNLYLGSGDFKVLAEGDSDVEDIDLLLYDQNYAELGADRLTDAHPIIDYNTLDYEPYHIELTNEASADSTPTFCMVGLMQVRP